MRELNNKIGPWLLGWGVLMLLSPLTTQAAVNISAAVDRTNLALEESLTYSLEITGDMQSLPDPVLPQLHDFDVYSSGSNQSFNWVNGQVSSSVRINYILVPKKTGTLTIGSATLTVDGNIYRTAPINITVSDPTPSTPPTQQRIDKPAPAPSAVDGKNRLYVEALLDRDTIYVNQSVTLIFRFYRGERLNSSPEYRPPSLTDFWKEDLPPNRKYYRTINNVRYDVTEIQTALFPISAGTKGIDAFTLTAMVTDNTRRSRRDPFGMLNDDFFSVFRQGKPVTMSTKSLSLVVLPLPTEGRPPEFSGLVGSFDITTQYDRTTVAVNEPITAKVTISGQGNIKSVTEPNVTAPEDFRLYNAGSEQNISKAGYKVSGSKTFEEVFVPRRAGTYELPGFNLTYFDPDRQRYVNRHTPPVNVTVTPGEGEFSIPPRAAGAEDIGYLAKDIRFLKSLDGPPARAKTASSHILLWLSQVVPLLGFGLVIIARRRRDHLNSDVAYRRARYARRTARKKLAHARKLAAGAEASGFYAAVAEVLADYFGDRFNCSGKGLTRVDISAAFAEAGIDARLSEEFISILDRCDQARFAPGAGGAASLLEECTRTGDLLDRLDKAWSRKSG
ncbi:BatD family protein [Candidatus Zixiibacteriota bacterium]